MDIVTNGVCKLRIEVYMKIKNSLKFFKELKKMLRFLFKWELAIRIKLRLDVKLWSKFT